MVESGESGALWSGCGSPAAARYEVVRGETAISGDKRFSLCSWESTVIRLTRRED